MLPVDLTQTLALIAEDTAQGLSMGSAAARQGILRRPLVAWLRLADEGVEPFHSWLVQVCRADADARKRYWEMLAQFSNSVTAMKDYRHMRGTPSELERELVGLRKSGLTRQARLDARKLQRTLEGR